MAYDSGDIRNRQQKQQHRPSHQQRQRRRMTMSLVAAGVVLALCGLVILVVNLIGKPSNPDTIATTPTAAAPAHRETVITLSFGGDLNVTDKVVASGAFESGYDYTNVFMDIVPLLARADASVLNFEGNVCGSPYGTQTSSAPKELLDALSAAGVDLIQMANSSSINNGLLGLRDTLTAIRDAGMQSVGAYASPEEARASKGFTLRSIYGVKVAFVSFTKGMSKGKDSLGLPEGSEDCVNLLYTDYTSTYQNVDTKGITEILRAVEQEKPDVTIALLHWGSEYNDQISSSQIQIQELMQKEGVDAIIGTHSHYVQKVDYDRNTGALVAWSLGDFFGDGEKRGTQYSIMLELQITKNNETGTTKITGFDYTPIYTVTQERDGVPTNKLLRIREAIAAYEADAIGKVSEQTYTTMRSALSKIASRVNPER